MSAYAVESDDLVCVEGRAIMLLCEVEARLYAPEPLSGDERRDLANRINAVLSSLEINVYPG